MKEFMYCRCRKADMLVNECMYYERNDMKMKIDVGGYDYDPGDQNI